MNHLEKQILTFESLNSRSKITSCLNNNKSFANYKSDSEDDKETPKILWGIANNYSCIFTVGLFCLSGNHLYQSCPMPLFIRTFIFIKLLNCVNMNSKMINNKLRMTHLELIGLLVSEVTKYIRFYFKVTLRFQQEHDSMCRLRALWIWSP